MFIHKKIVIVCLVLTVVHQLNQPPPHSTHTDYNHMQVVLTWPPTLCATGKVTCKSPIPLDLSLHGLWAAKIGGQTIDCSSTAPPPDLTSVFANLAPHLENHWPSIVLNRNPELHWNHEYNKHGICGEPNPKLYFQSAVLRRQEINFRRALKDYNIVPSHHDAYNHARIIDLGKKAMGHELNVRFSCIQINDTHAKLHELFACLEPNLQKFTSCPGDIKGSCFVTSTGAALSILIPPST